MNTIVSAFVSNVNFRYNNSVQKYYEYGKPLLMSSVPKIIFVDKAMLDCIGENYNKENTLLVEISKYNYSYLHEYQHLLFNFHLNTDNYAKDTQEFIFTMCNKTEWIKKAIEINHFNTENFIWIDFGIRYIFKNCTDNEFTEKINNIQFKLYDNVRIGGIWNINYAYNIDIYKDISWYFAGGVFGGNKNNLLKFAEQMKTKCLKIINEHHTLMWEVNVWYLIYLEHKDLFCIYQCDHNPSIIANY